MSQYTEKEYVIFMARKILSHSVYNMAALEGNPFTFIEVETLLDGVTIGGRRIQHHDQVIRISKAWNSLLDDVVSDDFELSADYAKRLHATLGQDEALVAGEFRNRSVSIRGSFHKPPHHAELNALFEEMVSQASKIEDPKERAIGVFLACAKSQFFFDCNKRMGQFLMNGILLANAQPIIAISVNDKDEFFSLIVDYYNYGNDSSIRSFLRDSQLRVSDWVTEREKNGKTDISC